MKRYVFIFFVFCGLLLRSEFAFCGCENIGELNGIAEEHETDLGEFCDVDAMQAAFTYYGTRNAALDSGCYRGYQCNLCSNSEGDKYYEIALLYDFSIDGCDECVQVDICQEYHFSASVTGPGSITMMDCSGSQSCQYSCSVEESACSPSVTVTAVTQIVDQVIIWDESECASCSGLTCTLVADQDSGCGCSVSGVFQDLCIADSDGDGQPDYIDVNEFAQTPEEQLGLPAPTDTQYVDDLSANVSVDAWVVKTEVSAGAGESVVDFVNDVMNRGMEIITEFFNGSSSHSSEVFYSQTESYNLRYTDDQGNFLGMVDYAGPGDPRVVVERQLS